MHEIPFYSETQECTHQVLYFNQFWPLSLIQTLAWPWKLILGPALLVKRDGGDSSPLRMVLRPRTEHAGVRYLSLNTTSEGSRKWMKVEKICSKACQGSSHGSKNRCGSSGISENSLFPFVVTLQIRVV